ncbi:MAG TPA: hypothetical protein PLJ84_08315 [Bacteroidales bacterium]|nr:hypothetical protein [Bacteroidales bacterium]HPT02591.1 hypothetical protein [Bacteroidales bacterium]
MGFLNNIRQKLACRRLNQEHQKLARIRKSTSLENARAIGILYYLPDEDTYKQVEEFIRLLTDMNLKVRVACYTDNKIPPHYFIPKLLQDIITPKDLSWIGVPEKLFVPDFLAEKFDILIDLSLTDHFPLLYLAALSKASLKIGRYDASRQEFFDMMIHTSPDTSLQEFTEQILHYLKMFNNTNKA